MRPGCRVQDNRAPSRRFRPECQPGRCGLRCTLSWLLEKKEDRNGKEGKGFRDERLLRRLSASLIEIWVTMREVLWRVRLVSVYLWKRRVRV